MNDLSQLDKFKKYPSGHYQYNPQGQLMKFDKGSYPSVGDGTSGRTFSYDEFNRLKTVNQLNKKGIVTASYSITYSDGDRIEEVKAYNGKEELEYTVKYEYTYH